MKKLKLKKKQFIDNTKIFKNKNIYYSGFCLTDNDEFAFFDVSEQFLLDNQITNVLSFKLSEDDLQMLIDRNPIKLSIGGDFVSFGNMGLIKRNLYNLIINLFPNCLFCKVINWQNKQSNRLIVVLADQYSKPLVMLKTKIKGG